MIYHLKDGGAIRTQVTNPGVIECQHCGTTWTEKRDMWQDCAAGPDVERHETQARDVATVKRQLPVRDPALPRQGTVVEKDPPALPGLERVR